MAIIPDRQPSNQTRSGDYTTEDLIELAKLQGGALGEVAEEVSNPKRSMLSNVWDGVKDGFSTFADVIDSGNRSVAGALSPDMTMAEARENAVNVSTVLWGDKKEDLTGFEKIGSFVGRVATDILFDPLTYVTFGAGRGLIGIVKGGEAYLGQNAAKQFVNKKVGDSVVLSKEGDKAIDKLIQSKRNGLRQDYLRQKKDKLFKERISKRGIDLKSDEALEELRYIDSEVNKIDEAVSDFEIETILNAKLDRQDAVKTMSRMFENPKNHGLMQKYIDQGGIKMFGKTLLDGQRIRKSIMAIPGWSRLDEMTKAPRYQLSSMFSANYRPGTGRMPQMVIDQRQKYKDLANSKNNEMLRKIPDVLRQLEVTENEAKFITHAIEHGLKPNDPKASAVWEMANGIKPDENIIRPEVWTALGFTKRELNKTLKQLRESGVPVHKNDNYIRHYLLKEPIKAFTRTNTSSQETKSRVFARISALEDDSGKRMAVEFDRKPDRDGYVRGRVIIDGEEQRKTFKVFNATKEKEKVRQIARNRTQSLQKMYDSLGASISREGENVKEKFAESMVDQIEQQLEGVASMTSSQKKDFANAFKEQIDNKKVIDSVRAALGREYKDGMKVKGGRIDGPDLEKLHQDLAEKNMDLAQLTARVQQVIKEPQTKISDGKTAAKKTPGGTPDKEAARIAREMKKKAEQGRKNFLKNNLDQKGVEDLMESVLEQYMKNPTGISNSLRRIIKDSQEARDIVDEMEDIARSLRLDEQEFDALKGRYVDTQSGKAFDRVRGSIEEAKELGFEFEENSAAITMMASYEATKVAATRHLVKDLAASFGVPASRATDMHRAVNQTGLKDNKVDIATYLQNKDGEQLLFHNDVADSIEEFGKTLAMDESIDNAMQAYDKLQNYFKASVTAIWPAFHGRNAISNVMQMYTTIGSSVFNPANHYVSASLINLNRQFKQLQVDMEAGKVPAEEFNKFVNKTVLTDRSGHRWTFGEFRKAVTENVVAYNPRNLGQIDQSQFARQDIQRASASIFPSSKENRFTRTRNFTNPVTGRKFSLAGDDLNPINTQNAVFQTGFKVGEYVEDHSRLMVFTNYLRETGDVQLAAKKTKEVLFDYQNLSEFERSFMRRIFPFYTFSRKNIELQAKTLFQRPGRTAALTRSLYTIGDVFGQDRLTEEEMDALPEWMQDGARAVLANDGDHLTLLSSLGSPIEQALGHLDPDTIVNMATPLAKVPLEKATGYSFFYGKDISEVDNASAFKSAPDVIKDYIGFTELKGENRNTGEEFTYYTALRPGNMHTIMSLPPTSRVWSTLRSLQDEDIEGQYRLMNFLIGVQPEEFDLTVQRQRAEDAKKKRIQDLLEKARAGYSFEVFQIPEEQREKIGQSQ